MSRSATTASFYKFDATQLFDNASTDFPLPQTTLTADVISPQLLVTSYSYSLLSVSKPEICTTNSSMFYRTLQIDEPSPLFAERDYYSLIGAAETERSQLPSWVKLTATLDTIFPAYDIQKIAVQGNLVFLATKHAGLQIVDMTDTTQPSPISSYPLDVGEGEDITLLDNIALFAVGTSGLHIINITNPARPAMLNIVPPLNNSATMAVTAIRHTALALNVHGLQVINIHKPRHPKIEQVLAPAGWDADTLS